MMNEAYFVGKNILLDWINNFLEINLDKVECCATGAVYCNLFDALHPGTIPMSRVDFTVKYEYDYAKNWKLLQNAFLKAGIDKVIPVQRLCKARYQDNLEFLQWMVCIFCVFVLYANCYQDFLIRTCSTNIREIHTTETQMIQHMMQLVVEQNQKEGETSLAQHHRLKITENAGKRTIDRPIIIARHLQQIVKGTVAHIDLSRKEDPCHQTMARKMKQCMRSWKN